jgi:hypothetical protein
MKSLKIIEWIGFIILLVSVVAYGIVRHNYLNNNLLENITISVGIFGALISIIAFVLRKGRKSSHN